MGKRKWDGSFCEAQYVETGNIVNDVIENDGRILHESTLDGYTHEMVDRGSYISDDYYFPQMAGGKKPHIHYEIRSNGTILIDGKTISGNRTGGEDTMRLRRSHTLDHSMLEKESADQVQEGTRLHELGTQFEADKAKLEAEIDKVQSSSISEADKQKLVGQLESAIVMLQEQYEREVAEEEQKVQEELEGQIEAMEEAITELEQQAYSLRSVQMDVAAMDASAAASAAEAQRQAFEDMKGEYVDKLKLQMEQAEIQQRNIRSRHLSGR